MPQNGRRHGPQGVWRFGNAELHETTGQLRVAGQPQALDRSSLQVLRHLLEHAGEVVTKDELLDAGWPGRVVAENSLAKAVSRLRAALGEAAGIRAVHGYGYRLACPARFEPQTDAAPGVPAAPQPQVGDILPGPAAWELVRPLGQGSTGITFLARSAAAGERVLKLARDENGIRGLRREIALARYIRQTTPGQQCVAPVLDWNLEEAPCYLELPYYPDGNLHDWALARGGLAAIAPDTRLALCVALCETVAVIHDLGIIHRDLKPENLYPVADGDGWRVVVADLGAGEAVLPPQPGGPMPTLGASPAGSAHSPVAGSLLYIAPEVMAGEVPTQRSDLYALGVLVFQLMGADLRGALAPGWEARIGDPLLCGDIARAAAVDPRQRTLDARALARHLRELPPRRAARRRERARVRLQRLEASRRSRERRRRRFGLAVTLCLGVGLVATGLMYLKTEQRRQQAETAIAQREAMLDFVTRDILGQADPYDSRSAGAAGDGIRAAVDRAAQRVDGRLQHDPRAAAAVHGMLGSIYFAQDAHQRAITHLEKARTYALASGNEDPGALVRIETTLCDVHRIGHHHDAAEEACASALGHAREGGTGQPLATLKLAQLRGEQGRHAESLQLLRPLLESRALGDDLRLNGELHWALGLSERSLGDYPAARAHFERLLEVAQAMGDDSSWLGWAYNSLGSVLVETGQYDKAESMLQRARDVFVRTQGPDQIEAQMPQIWRAEIRLFRGQWDEAAVLLRGIRQAWQGRLAPDHPLQQRVNASLAWADAMAGRTAEATAALAALPAENGRPADRVAGSRTLRWTRVALALGDSQRAAEFLQRFEDDLLPGLPEQHPMRAEARCLRSRAAAADPGTRVQVAAGCRLVVSTVPAEAARTATARHPAVVAPLVR